MRPTIVIVLPHLGDSPERKEGLEKCLKSVEGLDWPIDDLELLVVEGDGTVPEKVRWAVDNSKGEIICYAANDMTFEPDTLKEAVDCMDRHAMGLVSFNSGPVYPDEGNICEHFIIRRDILPKIGGEVFYTKMKHCGVDNLLWAQCSKLGLAMRCDTARVTHNHFTKADGMKYDDVYRKGWQHAEDDRKILAEELAKI